MKVKSFSARIAAIAIAAMTCISMTACSSESSQNDETISDTTAQTDAATTENQNADADAEIETLADTEPTTEHSSPTETVTSKLGIQKNISNAVLNHETSKNYAVSLSDILQDGDTVQSFIFELEADSNIGVYQGGCGISVTEDCPAATNDYWYQSDDFSVEATGSYVRIVWDVPAEIQEYIDLNGTVQLGYWWGDTEQVSLQYLTCNYTRTKTLPVDDTVTLDVNQNLAHDDTVSISLSEILDDGYTPQALTFEISADAAFDKFSGEFGIDLTSDICTSGTITEFTDENHISLTWLIPDDVKSDIPKTADIQCSCWWSDTDTVTLDSVTIKYSYGAQGKLDPNRLPDDAEIQVVYQNEDAFKIAENITMGWNLGNTLDCYDISWSVTEFETAWGNPKTTKQMIDTVKAAGFNAIRIPVSWTDHIDDDGTIDSIWLSRVQQVVDYAIDNDMYTIINMHHDDYTWLNPTYADEEEITETYIKVWSQIAERFKNYDTKLLFEGLNEPRVVGSDDEWTGGTTEEHTVINHLLQAFVDTVRASGGNNSLRTLIITTHAASSLEKAVNGLEIPDDDNLIVSVHYYAPWKFTTYEFSDDTAFSDEGKAELEETFAYLHDVFIENGIPVIIGEFGAENKNNTSDRAEYYAYYLETASSYGIPCFIWDNGVFTGEGSYGLLDRENCTWYFDEIISSIQNAMQ